MIAYRIKHMPVPDWEKIPSAVLEDTGWLPHCPISASAQLCHNGQDLFVRMEAVEPDIRATLANPLDQVCEDSCLEFFFAPLAGDIRYFNFEVNPLGNIYIGFGGPRDTRVRQLPINMAQFEISPFRTGTGWGITYRIPGSFIRTYMPEFVFTGEAACNFYKCGDLTPAPHYYSWSPMTCTHPDYHRRQDFGKLIFD